MKGGAAQTVAPGQAASLPFTLQFAGAPSPAFVFSLSATTTIPGAIAAATPGSVVPANTDPINATVIVAVPAGTAPGTYPVTLAATLGTVTKTGSSSIVIPGPPGRRRRRRRDAADALEAVRLAQVDLPHPRRQAGDAHGDAGPGRHPQGRRHPRHPGRRKNGKCVVPTAKLIRNGAKRCTRFVPVTTITRANLAAGLRSVTFSGRNRVPGLYRLSVTVRAAGLVSLPKTTTVTVKP